MKVLNYIKQLLVAFYQNFVKVPLRLLSHPVLGYTEFKEDKKGKLSVGIGMVLIYALLTIIRYNADGIIINKNDPTKFNSILLIVYAVMPLVILSVANWSISTLMDGKATMKQIFTMGGYSYFPLIIFGIINVVLSNFLTVDEAQIITLLSVLGFVLMGYMIFMGLVVIHEYGVAKADYSSTMPNDELLQKVEIMMADLQEKLEARKRDVLVKYGLAEPTMTAEGDALYNNAPVENVLDADGVAGVDNTVDFEEEGM